MIREGKGENEKKTSSELTEYYPKSLKKTHKFTFSVCSSVVEEKTFFASSSEATLSGFKYLSHTIKLSADSKREAAGFQ